MIKAIKGCLTIDDILALRKQMNDKKIMLEGRKLILPQGGYVIDYEFKQSVMGFDISDSYLLEPDEFRIYYLEVFKQEEIK